VFLHRVYNPDERWGMHLAHCITKPQGEGTGKSHECSEETSHKGIRVCVAISLLEVSLYHKTSLVFVKTPVSVKLVVECSHQEYIIFNVFSRDIVRYEGYQRIRGLLESSETVVGTLMTAPDSQGIRQKTQNNEHNHCNCQASGLN
jgi:hypothetical protein